MVFINDLLLNCSYGIITVIFELKFNFFKYSLVRLIDLLMYTQWCVTKEVSSITDRFFKIKSGFIWNMP